jgi:NAD(P)-dependent dehydrogenase (short-subunit alcohol dehydrogenase family)
LDVTDSRQVAAAVQLVASQSPRGLHALVNNAGMAIPSAVELMEVEELRRLFEVNAVAPLGLIQRCLPLLRRVRGRIVNVSSMNGYCSLPMVGGYSASKFALEALSEALRIELRPWGIRVSLIRPGQVRTPIFDKAREEYRRRTPTIPHELRPGYERLYEQTARFNERGARSSTTAEDVAQVAVKAIESRRPRACYVVGFDAWGLQVLKWLAPAWVYDRVLARATGILGTPFVGAGEEPAELALRNEPAVFGLSTSAEPPVA